MHKEYNKFLKNSLLEIEFNKLLENEAVKVISFDIFETLVFRKVSHHNDIFYEMGKSKFIKNHLFTPESFQNFRIKAEKNARKNGNNEINFNDIYKEFNLTKQDKKAIQQIELETEKKNLYVNEQVLGWIKKALNKSKKVILVSDMYLSLEELKYIILDEIECLKDIFCIYVSSEYGVRKSTGKLFEVVCDDLDIKGKELFHIGDKIDSDFEIPKKRGHHALLYNININSQKVFDYESKYVTIDTKQITNFRKIALMLNPFSNQDEEFYFNYGASIFGPVFWEFSHWLNELIIRKNIEQVNFIMREGKIFRDFFQKINQTVSTNLIYASRKSTYLVKETDIDFSSFNFFRFRKFSIKDVYTLYKLRINSQVLIENRNVALRDATKVFIDEKSLYDIFVEDFCSRKNEIKENIEHDKDVLSQYLETLDIKENSILIDFGGTGTIINNLMHLLEKKPKYKILFFMHELGYERQVENQTLSFLPYSKDTQRASELIRRSPEVFEILLNTGEETTVSYKKITGEVFPIKQNVSFEMPHLTRYINAFYKGIEVFFSILFNYAPTDRISKEAISMILARCIEVPTRDEVDYLGELYTDEGKGSGSINKVISPIQLERLQKLGIDRAYYNISQHLMYDITNNHWLHGCITKLDDNYIATMKGLLKVYPNQNYINEIIDTLTVNNIFNVNIYGAGVLFDKLKPYLNNKGISIESLMDSRASFGSFEYESFIVDTIDNTINEKNSFPIIVASVEYSSEITDLISKYLYNNSLSNSIINSEDGLIKIKDQ